MPRLQPKATSFAALAATVFLSAWCSTPSYGQFRQIDEPASAKADTVNDWVGRTFWTSPRGEAVSSVTFHSSPDGSGGRFEVTEDTRFVVEGIEEQGPITWLRVRFIDSGDDRKGYLMVDTFRRHSQPPKRPFFQWSITNYNISEAGPPAEEIKALRDAAVDAEQASIASLQNELDQAIAARKANPPRIGMSANEVSGSSWGKPSDINRITTQGQVTEQWVYPWGYVYLKNGQVTAVQD